ncbi:NACHT domain-containing protein [Streptomyces sp. NPDC015350]|uniref:NACHT domain-containing protein n=1 Tax=Streptomyces sp. NPDC015350 TaxID=3364955 RepID=UPI003701FDAB
MFTPGQRSRRGGSKPVLVGLLVLLALFILQELGAGLLPDIYKGFAGDDRKTLVIGASVAFVLVGLLLYIVHLQSLVPEEAEPELGAEERARARAALLHAVRRSWTDGTDRAWERSVRIELGLAEHRTAVHDPWGPPRLSTGGPEGGVPLAAGTRIDEVFDRHHAQLLVLGAPGAGKTSRMLELTEKLAETAERDDDAPVPAVLLLTDWHGAPFAHWVLDELHNRYRLPRETGLALLRDNGIALVLDGLDEVAPRLRVDCVRAINGLLSAEQYPHCPIAVSCRSTDYDELGERLTVSGAVRVRPLEVAAVHALLNGGGERLRGLAAAAAADPVLARLLSTPLMLGVAVFAYEGVEEGEVVAPGDAEERRGRIFDAYIERMIHRDRTLQGRPVTSERPAGRVRADLLRLARDLNQVHSTVYYADDFSSMILQAPDEVLRRMAPSGTYPVFRFMRGLSGYEAGNPDSRPNRFYWSMARFWTLSPFTRPALARHLRRDFLDYATDRAIMRRAGDGYAFLHKTIQDHLAARAERMSVAELRELERSPA